MTLRVYRMLGLTPRMRRLADGFVQLERNARAAQAAWAKQLALIAERVCADNQAQWRADLGLRGEAYVKVGWDPVLQVTTHERIDPGEIVPSLAYPPPPSAREPDRPLRRMLGHPEAEPHDWVRRRMSEGTHEHRPWVPPEHWRDLGEVE